MFGDVPLGTCNDPEPGNRPIAHGPAVVARQHRLDPDARRCATMFRREAPHRHVFVVFAQRYTVVRAKFVWMPWFAALRKVARRSAQDAPVRCKPTADKR